MLLSADSVHIFLLDSGSSYTKPGLSTFEATSVLDAFLQEGKGYTQPLKVNGTTIFRAMENRKGVNKLDDQDNFKGPGFQTLEQAFESVRDKYVMCHPIKK